MAINSAIQAGVRNYPNGYGIRSISGQELRWQNFNLLLTAQQNTEVVVPNFPIVNPVAAQHFTAKGQLLVGTGAGTFTTLSGGTGDVLKVAADGSLAFGHSNALPLNFITADQTMLAGMTYICNGAATLNLALPVGTDRGQYIKILNVAKGFKVTQSDAAHQVSVGYLKSAVGATGYFRATADGDVLELLSLGNNKWMASQYFGAFQNEADDAGNYGAA